MTTNIFLYIKMYIVLYEAMYKDNKYFLLLRESIMTINISHYT